MKWIRNNWRGLLARLPLPMLALAASYGVYQFASLFVPYWAAIIQAAAFELTYLGLAVVDVPEKERKARATRISLSAVAVSVVYNSAAGYFHRNPAALSGLSFGEELALAIAHGAPLAIVAYLVADLLFHTQGTLAGQFRKLLIKRRKYVRKVLERLRTEQKLLERTGRQLAETGNARLSLQMTFEEESARFNAESAHLSDLIRMEEAKSAQLDVELRRERDSKERLSADVRRLESLVADQSARLEASDVGASLEVRNIAQAMRDEGLALRTIAGILGVSEKTIRNWTADVRSNGHLVER